MAFEQKTWTNRVAEFINRRILTKDDGTTELVTVTRSEGQISQEGDAFNAENMNDLEQRIADEFASQNVTLAKLNTDLSNVGKRTVLWENQNAANADFATQTISLDLSDADEIEVHCCVNNSINYGIQIYRFSFVNGTIGVASKVLQGSGNYTTLYIRTFTMYTDRISVSVGAVQASTGANTINNNAQVPFKIVKIKY